MERHLSMRCRTKARRPARSSNLKRHALGRVIRSGTTRVQQSFTQAGSCCPCSLCRFSYTLLKKKKPKTKTRNNYKEGGKAQRAPAQAANVLVLNCQCKVEWL
jgi:phosphohistidine phosphatase SixA